MKVTFTNASSAQVAVSAFYKTLDAGESVTVSMTAAQYDQEAGLKALVEAGTLTLAFSSVEAGDATSMIGMSGLAVYSDGTRPAATAVPPFTSIWNTTDGTPNWSNGTNWIGIDGLVT